MKKTLLLCCLVITTALKAKIITISTEEDYKKQILDNNDPIVIKFSADWCSVCNNVSNPFKEVAAEPEFSSITFALVDVDALDNVSKQNAIVGVPTFVYRNNGAKIMEEVGVKSMPDFKKDLRDNLKSAFKNDAKPTTNSIAEQPKDTTDAVAITETVTIESTPETTQPSTIAQILQSIMGIFTMITTTIKSFFTTIIDAIKGFFGN